MLMPGQNKVAFFDAHQTLPKPVADITTHFNSTPPGIGTAQSHASPGNTYSVISFAHTNGPGPVCPEVTGFPR